MPDIPAAILDSLNTVQADKSALDTAVTEQGAAAAALANAVHDKDQADGTVVSATTQLNSDANALVALINSTYRPTPAGS